MRFFTFSKLVLASFILAPSAFAVSPFNLPWFNHSSDEPATFNSSDYENGVFVLEVYQLHCGPCNTNEPNVVNLASDYAEDDQVKILDLGIDQDQNSYKQWVQKFQQSHPVLIDTGRSLSRELGVQYTPTTYVLDCNLNIKWQHVGVWSQANVDEIKETIETLKGQSCSH